MTGFDSAPEPHAGDESAPGGLGLVEPQSVQVLPGGLALESGASLPGPITVAYETYGTLAPRRDNAVLLCHALSGGAHAAGSLPGHDKPGWWDIMVGPGRAFDTNKYFVICSNVIGGCYGTTGPSSTNPATGRPYGLAFPVVTVRDMVAVQAALLDYLGIERLLSVAGGSMGGMQALQWPASHPRRVASTIAIATTPRHSPQQIAFNEAARQAVMADPAWMGGDYYGTPGPRQGLAVARMIGHITYLSDAGMEQKFGRRLRGRERAAYDFSAEFEVESYLRHQGKSFVERFDANSLLYLSKALDYCDIANGHGSLEAAFALSPARHLLIAFTSDWLYPPAQLDQVKEAVTRAGRQADFRLIASDYGHDAFLLEHRAQEPMIRGFLREVYEHIQDA